MIRTVVNSLHSLTSKKQSTQNHFCGGRFTLTIVKPEFKICSKDHILMRMRAQTISSK